MKAAETAVVIFGSITNVNKKLLSVVVYVAAQLTCGDQNGIFCEFGKTASLGNSKFFRNKELFSFGRSSQHHQVLG